IARNLLADVPHLHDPAVLEAEDVHHGVFLVGLGAPEVGQHRNPIAGIDDLLHLEGLVGLARGGLFHRDQEGFAITGKVRVVVDEGVRHMALVGVADIARCGHGEELDGDVTVASGTHGNLLASWNQSAERALTMARYPSGSRSANSRAPVPGLTAGPSSSVAWVRPGCAFSPAG